MTESELSQLLQRNKFLSVSGVGATTDVVRDNLPLPTKENALQGEFERNRKKEPNKTEMSYTRLLELEYPGCKISFEGISLKLENGHRYTPDLCVHASDGLMLVEVKNAAYKHASYGRSKMAFNQCRIDYPQFKYRWTEKDKNTWNTSNY